MIIALPNGKTEVIFDERDFLNLLEEHMGYDARRWLQSSRLSPAGAEGAQVLQ